MRRIAILTSGGDTPGMNAAIHSVVMTAKTNGISVIGVERGYKGLIEGRLYELHSKDVRGIVNKGGTMLKTARCLEMKTEEGKKQAVKVLNAFGVEGLVVIGGDGSFKGAQALSELGIPTVGLPGTIDNDLAYTDFTIGFDTAVNCVLDEIAKIRDTMLSHERVGVIEVMGRTCGYIALNAGIAGEVENILVPEVPFDIDSICDSLNKRAIKGLMTSLIIIAEGAGKGEAVANYLRAKTGFDVKAIKLGYVQRGGTPTSFDRLIAIKMGERAVKLLMQGEAGRVVGIRDNKIVDYEINEALDMKLHFDKELYDEHIKRMSY